MQAYHIERTGSLDGLVLREHETPRHGPRQALVRVRAMSLNYRDLLILKAGYSRAAAPDVVPLSDGAGEVVAVGSEVVRVAAGDRVAVAFFPCWPDGRLTPEFLREQLGSTHDGLAAEYRLCHEESLVRIPQHLSFEEAATLPCAAVTAWSSLTGPRPVLPGETVLTLGTGGVAIFGLQLAKLFGARVIATTSSDEKAKRLLALGASDVVNYRTTPDWSRAVLALTSGRGVDHVVETTGGDTLPHSLLSCAPDAQIAMVGVLRAEGGTLDARVFSGSASIRRIRVGSRAAFEAMNRAISLHALRPVIDRVFPFAALEDAYRHLESRAHVGKVVVNAS